MSVGTALRKRRDELGQTMDEAAEHFGVSRQTWSMWEKDAMGVNLNADKLDEIGGYLGTDRIGTLIAIGWLDDGTEGTATVRGSGAYVNGARATFTSVTDIGTRRARREAQHREVVAVAS